MNTLEKICADKLEHVHRTEHLIPEIVFFERAKFKIAPLGFCQAIRNANASGEPALIAEVKKASPSKVLFARILIRSKYQDFTIFWCDVYLGFTDQPYFKGSDEDLEAVKSTVAIPVSAKTLC
jgi:indole-3-glycerol phosphate synthase